jgi:hypothetical protein
MRFCLFVAIGLFAVGCSEKGTAQDTKAPIKVETSQMYVTVLNNSGLALNDVTVAIIPVGRSTVYNKFVGRLENTESRNLMLGEFFGRDGTPFSLRVAKPRSVEVKGKDLKGQEYAVDVAWR